MFFRLIAIHSSLQLLFPKLNMSHQRKKSELSLQNNLFHLFFSHACQDVCQFWKTYWFHSCLSTLVLSKHYLTSHWVTQTGNFAIEKTIITQEAQSWKIYMLNYTFHYIQNTEMNHISPLYCRRTPPACLLDQFQWLCMCLQASTCSSIMCNVYWWSREGATCRKPHSFA